MKQLRHKNGTFKSKRKAQDEQHVRAFMGFVPLSCIVLAGFILQPYKIVIERPIVHAEELPVQEEVISEPEEDDISNVYLPSDIDVSDETKQKIEKAINDIPHTSSTTEKWIAYLYIEAPKYGVDPDEVARTIWCESSWYNIQSGFFYPDGKQENSWGILQINLPSHKYITREQALDPYFSIDWALSNWEGEKWYGFSRSQKKCLNTTPEYW